MSNALLTPRIAPTASPPQRRSARLGVDRMFHQLPKGALELLAKEDSWDHVIARELREERAAVKEGLLLAQRVVSQRDRPKVFVAGSSVLYEQLARMGCLERPWGENSVNDIDAFLLGSGVRDNLNFRRFLRRVHHNLANLGKEVIKSTTYAHRYTSSLQEFKVHDIWVKGVDVKLSFIQAWFHKTPEDLVEDFDINIVKIFWPLCEDLEVPLKMAPDLQDYLKQGEACVRDMTVAGGALFRCSKQFISTSGRVEKYKARGFSFVHSPVMKVFVLSGGVREFRAVDGRLYEVFHGDDGVMWLGEVQVGVHDLRLLLTASVSSGSSSSSMT